jgi:acetyl esterase/lipase
MKLSLGLLLLLVVPLAAFAQDSTRKDDVIYGRKFGMALTMDVFTPKKPNGAGVIFCVSGGWFSAKQNVNPGLAKIFNDAGYTVFQVVHGSQPRFSIPEVLDDMHLAVRFIKHKAADFGIDPDRLGITGGSAGGHLSLMQGSAGRDGDPKAADPIARQSSTVRAVACFFPPTDFLNYGEPGKIALGGGTLKNFKAPFEFVEFNAKTQSFDLITDEKRRIEIGKMISPVTHAKASSAPTLIIHGDKDKLVPIQQAELMIEALKKVNVPAKLVVKEGGDHGWGGMDKDIKQFVEWFDVHLAKK